MQMAVANILIRIMIVNSRGKWNMIIRLIRKFIMDSIDQSRVNNFNTTFHLKD